MMSSFSRNKFESFFLSLDFTNENQVCVKSRPSCKDLNKPFNLYTVHPNPTTHLLTWSHSPDKNNCLKYLTEPSKVKTPFLLDSIIWTLYFHVLCKDKVLRHSPQGSTCQIYSPNILLQVVIVFVDVTYHTTIPRNLVLFLYESS